jgi:archaellum biogenesis ATPase FlaH
MNEFLIKYIGAAFTTLTLAAISTSISLVSTVRLQTNQIESLEERVMNSDLINEKFKHFDANLKDVKKSLDSQDDKLDKILNQTK